jgi:2-polyprenyl-3-methyl-5-hydroxy-6-metoxy-1,4-benzoquinol methylase
MDILFAPIYDQRWGRYINPTHTGMLRRFLALCPPHATILEAGCGTGKYWPMIVATGRSVAGIDQSQGMLDIARAKFPHVPVRKLGLQELHDQAAFDGIICIDVMENVFPEDWPLVLRNCHHALRAPGLLYLTVELETPEALAHALEAGRELGLPLVEGEVAHEGSYHYYPAIDQVRDWMRQTHFSIAEEAEGDGYYHILAHKL